MKLLSALLLSFFMSRSLLALPIGNPAEPAAYRDGIFFCGPYCDPCAPCFQWFDAWSLRIGYYGDFVFNHHLRADLPKPQRSRIRSTELFTNAGSVTLNICERLDLFGTFGVTQLSLTTNESSWLGGGVAEGRFDWKPGSFSWSAGARATLFCLGCFSLGAEGQYFEIRPKLDSYFSFADGRRDYFENIKTRYQEWQAGAALSYSFSTDCHPNLSFVPYAGVKASWVRLRSGDFQFIRESTGDLLTLFNLRGDKLWGYAIGLSTFFYEQIGVTVEGRFANEKALFVSAQFRF